MEMVFEALRNGDIGLNETSLPILFVSIPLDTLRWEKLFGCGKHSRSC
jgi:hypothetical protein